MPARFGLVGTKILLAPFHAISVDFSMDQKHANKLQIFLGGPMDPIHPVWGHVLVSSVWLWFYYA